MWLPPQNAPLAEPWPTQLPLLCAYTHMYMHVRIGYIHVHACTLTCIILAVARLCTCTCMYVGMASMNARVCTGKTTLLDL